MVPVQIGKTPKHERKSANGIERAKAANEVVVLFFFHWRAQSGIVLERKGLRLIPFHVKPFKRRGGGQGHALQGLRGSMLEQQLAQAT